MPLYFLNLFNFLVADVRDGLGPFLGVFLQQNHWQVNKIGFVMTLAGLTSIIITTPVSMLIDHIRYKKNIGIIATISIIIGCYFIYHYPNLPMTIISQMLIAIAGATLISATVSITMGLVGPDLFDKQIGYNESFNHAGNACAALIVGIASYYFGLKAIFILMSCSAFLAITALALIPSRQIDNKIARGLNVNQTSPQPFFKLLKNKKLFILAVTIGLFHLANAAMLPLLSQSMVAKNIINKPGSYTAMTIIIAQTTMIPMAIFAAFFAKRHEYRILLILALVALPARGLLIGTIQHPLVLLPAEILDGVGAGLIGVAIPGIVAKIMQGSGRFNTGLGIIFTCQGLCASCSHYLAGTIAKYHGYDQAFLTLSLIALCALLFWLVFTKDVSFG